MSNFESKFNLRIFAVVSSFPPSGSMEPAFHRGDLLFLTNRVEDPIRVGEIVVFRIEGREIPIVHRVLKIHEKYVQMISFFVLKYFYVSVFTVFNFDNLKVKEGGKLLGLSPSTFLRMSAGLGNI